MWFSSNRVYCCSLTMFEMNYTWNIRSTTTEPPERTEVRMKERSNRTELSQVNWIQFPILSCHYKFICMKYEVDGGHFAYRSRDSPKIFVCERTSVSILIAILPNGGGCKHAILNISIWMMCTSICSFEFCMSRDEYVASDTERRVFVWMMWKRCHKLNRLLNRKLLD